MELHAELTEVEGGCLVTLRLESDAAVRRRVRVANRLDGPVLPPRRKGVPERGWDRDGVSAVVPARGSLALGYACPAAPASPPAAVVDVGAPGEGPESDRTARARRECGDHRPPRTVLAGDDASAVDQRAASGPEEGDESTAGPPAAVTDWLAEVRDRVETVESLSDASVGTAAPVVRDAGGLAGVEAVAATLDEDAAALRAFATRASALAERAAEADPPLEPLRRLA